MFNLKNLILAVSICLFASYANAQKVLEKPIDEWTKSDAMEILSNSPWARIYQSNEGAAAAAVVAVLRDQADNRLTGSERGRSARSGGPPPVVFRLHSGLPIRLALIRMNQIAAGYDKMNDEAKSKFNESAKGLLDCVPCQSYYVVTATQFPYSSGESVEEGIFQAMTLEQMKGNVTLRNEKGVERELAHFIAPVKGGDSAVFFFARNDDKGSPLLTKDNSEVSLVFNSAFLTPSNRFAYLLPRRMDFKLSKVKVGDNVVF